MYQSKIHLIGGTSQNSFENCIRKNDHKLAKFAGHIWFDVVISFLLKQQVDAHQTDKTESKSGRIYFSIEAIQNINIDNQTSDWTNIKPGKNQFQTLSL